MANCKDCLFSTRMDHYEHGSWHEYYCKLYKHTMVDMGSVECLYYISIKPEYGTNIKKMKEYLNKEFPNG